MKVIRVTFDSNVWRKVVSPSCFPKDPARKYYCRINKAVRYGLIRGYLCETVFTLEALERKGRRIFIANYHGSSNSSIEESPNGVVKLALSLGPDMSNQPKSTPHLSRHWSDGVSLGFQILRIPRIAGLVNQDIDEESYYEPENFSDYVERLSKVARDVEGRGCGFQVLKTIGVTYSSNQKWMDGIRTAPSSEDNAIAKAVAEWADGDSVSAHVAAGNDYFCTSDEGKSAGSQSVLSPVNRAYLLEKHGVQFVSPEQFSSILKYRLPVWRVRRFLNGICRRIKPSHLFLLV